MKQVIRGIAICLMTAVAVAVTSTPVSAIQPSTQAELDKANANLIEKETELKKAFDYWDECKVKLDQAVATGDVNAIYYADLECQRSKNLVDWNASNYYNAVGYVDKVKKNIKREERKEDYTYYIQKRAEVDLAAGAYRQAQSNLKLLQDMLNQTQQSINDLNVALPTHPELAPLISEKTALIPSLQANIATAEAAVNMAKTALKPSRRSWSLFGRLYGLMENMLYT